MISMLDLLRTGMFSDLPFGMSCDAFTGKIGDTDWVAFSSRRDKSPSLLRYGNVEFFITSDSHLLYGFLWEPNDTEVPRADHRLQIDPWVLSGGIERTWVEDRLRETEIAFTGKLRADGIYSLSLVSGVSLDFFGDGEKRDTLGAVSVMRFDLLPDRVPTKQISVTLTADEVEIIRAHAAQRGVSVANFCAEWIRERLRVEENIPLKTVSSR